MSKGHPYFNKFKASIDKLELPNRFNDPFNNQPDPLCALAANEVQDAITANNWNHNFGLKEGETGKAIGKMFGVLVVKNAQNEIGYLAAFSGKIGDSNHYRGFVPPIFDGLEKDGFLERGMKKLISINQQIDELESDKLEEEAELKKFRTDHSNSLQEQIYESYKFLNGLGEVKGLKEIFETERQTKPPGGAGDCAAPRMLQYAFQNEMKPIAIAEFWWGRSEDSPQWVHKSFYPACNHKCKPILKHMLTGLV